MHERFSGIARLYGDAALERLRGARALVIGVGGVGSWTVEALARTGVGHLTLVDLDDVCVHNTNRQLTALEGEIGRPKVVVLAERARRIDPSCDVSPVIEFFTASTADALLADRFDVIVDAMDSLQDKCVLAERAVRDRLPLVTVGGVGGRRDPTRFAVADLNRTEGDPLLRQVRKRLKQRFGMERKGPWGIPCVFSKEEPSLPAGASCAAGPLDCDTAYGTAAFVSGAAGLILASVAVERVLAG